MLSLLALIQRANVKNLQDEVADLQKKLLESEASKKPCSEIFIDVLTLTPSHFQTGSSPTPILQRPRPQSSNRKQPSPKR